jgi:hypothetical protein
MGGPRPWLTGAEATARTLSLRAEEFLSGGQVNFKTRQPMAQGEANPAPEANLPLAQRRSRR